MAVVMAEPVTLDNYSSRGNSPLLTLGTDEKQDGIYADHAQQKRRQNIFKLLFLGLIVIAGVIVIVIVLYNYWSKSSSHDTECKNNQYLIVISLDGFRAEYFSNPDIATPHLDNIALDGVNIKSVIPVYPSLTFPNHYSIVTGLYPGIHGIVSNSFYDPILHETFYMSSNDVTGKWYRGEPIWLTHRMKQNIDKYSNFSSAVVFWVGSDHNASGYGYPEFYLNYNQSYPVTQRVETILELLESRNYRIILGYFEQPDKSGHDYGPNSNEVVTAVEQVDGLIGSLIDGIKNISHDLFMNTDIVITSDHGMTSVSNKSVIYINYTSSFNLYNDTDNFILDAYSSNLFIKLTQNSTFSIQQVEDLLQFVLNPIDLVEIFNRDNIPDSFKYSQSYNNRIADIMVIPSVGYQFKFIGIKESNQWWLRMKGNHGFNNTDNDMSAFFVARGPSFKKNYTKNIVENIHFYEMFCKIMCDMTPSENNGSIKQIQDILNL